MKIMTQNADVLLPGANRQKLRHLAEKIIQENITLIAMQNVAQTLDAEPISSELWEDVASDEGLPDVRRDNAAAMLAQFLKQLGKSCSWIWLPDNKADSLQRKGFAFLSVGRRIRCVDRFAVGTASQPVLGIQLEGMEDWFYQLSSSSWEVPKERFLSQWKLLNCCITSKRLCSPVWLIGGFGPMAGAPERYRESFAAGGWSEVDAEKNRCSNIWCSRKRETRPCTSKDRMYQEHNSAMVIDVKEDTL